MRGCWEVVDRRAVMVRRGARCLAVREENIVVGWVGLS